MEQLQRKAADNVWSQPEERGHVAVWLAKSKAIGVGLPRAVGVQIRTSQSSATELTGGCFPCWKLNFC